MYKIKIQFDSDIIKTIYLEESPIDFLYKLSKQVINIHKLELELISNNPNLIFPIECVIDGGMVYYAENDDNVLAINNQLIHKLKIDRLSCYCGEIDHIRARESDAVILNNVLIKYRSLFNLKVKMKVDYSYLANNNISPETIYYIDESNSDYLSKQKCMKLRNINPYIHVFTSTAMFSENSYIISKFILENDSND